MIVSQTDFPELQAYDVAHCILLGYMDYYYRFKLITKRAKIRFERRDWHGIQADAKSRINLYRADVQETTDEVGRLIGNAIRSTAFWTQVRDAYAEEVASFGTRNIAETFFNSVFRHFHQIGADPSLMFVLRKGTYRENSGGYSNSVSYTLDEEPLGQVMRRILATFSFSVPWEDFDRDVDRLTRRFATFRKGLVAQNNQAAYLDIMPALFFRNKFAYIVGRYRHGSQIHPFILPLLHPEDRGVFVDALLLESDQVTSIFSYHRSYFLAEVTLPSLMVDFLQSFMPTKRSSELYNAIGFEKHGKTVFYRELLDGFPNQEEAVEEMHQFVPAPGIAGMVMYVFTAPNLNMVFKVIRDKFAPPKKVTEQIVKEKYELVNQHDRVGRMSDCYLFQQLHLPKALFQAGCLEELCTTAAKKVRLTEDEVIISHVYIEKKMMPLNIYLAMASEKESERALRDYGRAIKQLAAANIFPGDLLLKNFGVTRVNRVVFYDYDEIELLTECNFRHIPEPKTYEQEMASSPWYYVGPKDIFPEEFPGFLMRAGPRRNYLMDRHPEIFNADFWNELKERLLAGEIMDVFPYRRNYRF